MKKFAPLFLCLMLCFLTIAFISNDHLLALTSPASDAASSIIRVKLSVGDLSEISVKLSGTYSIENRSLPAGDYLIRNQNNVLSIIDSTGSTRHTSPTSLMITENLNPDVNACNLITLRAGGYNRNYQGSMKFWIDGVNVDVVNHIYLEKYLYGVVAYEMSNYFPLEALKAQSVAARCFAIKRLEGARSGIYDIGDTSGDQVYKGYNPDYANVIRAVDETAGKVLLYNDSIITTYYTASNGGQTDRTENVWSAAMPYLKIRQDPFDLANPSSLQKTVYFPLGSLEDKFEDLPSPDTGSMPLTEEELAALAAARQDIRYTQDDLDSRLAGFLLDRAAAMLNGKNAGLPEGQQYQTDPETIKIKAVLEMTPIQTSTGPYCRHHADSTDDPPHDASNCPSIDFTGVQMSVILKVTQADAGKTSGYNRIDLAWDFEFVIASYLKSTQYPQWQVFSPTSGLRIFAVETGTDPNGIASFKLINRRYGHGIGLSQRGAQQRAWDANPQVNQYQNILAFYYPNTVLADAGLTDPLTPAPTLTPTPTPTPAPTPTPDEKTTLTVFFKDWDGLLLKTDTVNADGTATAPAAPERTGYTFIGWDMALTNIKTDLTITALYEANSLKVIPSSTLKFEQNQYLTSVVAAGMTVDDMLNQLETPSSLVQIFTPDNIRVTDTALLISTGMQVRLVLNGEITDQKTIIIQGDVTGDGCVSALDLLQLKKHLLGQITLQPANGEAAKVTGNAAISALDLLKLKKILLGQITIQ